MAWVNLNEVVTTWPPTGGVTAAVGDHVWTVDTLTELRAIATTDVDDISAIVRVGGHTTVGDGGGGDFYWDATSSAADDGGITILPTGYAGTGRWKRLFDGPVMLEWFGAVGDGVTVDTAAIKAALAYMLTINGGRLRGDPEKTYLIDDTLVVGSASYSVFLDGITARGGAKLKANAGFTSTMINLLRGGVSGWTIEGSSASTAGHYGIVIGDATNNNTAVKIRDIYYGGGLYRLIYSEYEYDGAEIDQIYAFSEIGDTVIRLETGASYPPAGTPKISRLHFNNTVTTPVGTTKRTGLYLSRTDSAIIENCIINNYDTCLDIRGGITTANYNLEIVGVHLEDHRTAVSGSTTWAATTAYVVGDYVRPTGANMIGQFYKCTTAGTSGGAEPTWPTTDGGTVVDGTVTWTEVGLSVGINIGINNAVRMSGIWSDGSLVGIRTAHGASTSSLHNSRISGTAAIRHANTAACNMSANDSLLTGDVRLTWSAGKLYLRQRNVSISSDTAAEVPNTANAAEFSVNGTMLGQRYARAAKTADYTVNPLTDHFIEADATAASFTITIPETDSARVFIIHKMDNTANTVTVAMPQAFLRSGSTSYVLRGRGQAVVVYTRGGTNPLIIGEAYFAQGSATYDPASLADGAGATTTVTVNGAALGDYAEASFSNDLQGITLTAWVSAANTVSVRFQNETGGAIDLASGTLRAKVTKPI